MEPDRQPASPMAIMTMVLLAFGFALGLLEYGSQELLRESEAGGGVAPSHAPLAAVCNAYLAVREHVVEHWLLWGLVVAFVPPLIYVGLRRLARARNAWKAAFSGMALSAASYALPRIWRGPDAVADGQRAFIAALEKNPAPDRQVVLGFDRDGAPVFLTDRQRDMHAHVLGQPGSGKTQSVLSPLLYQDVARGRGVLFMDAKGSAENEELLAEIAAATGRTGELLQYTMNPLRLTHTYSPVYLVPDADPRQVAERVFATFEGDLDVSYYRDLARELWINLVCACAGTGKQVTMADLGAAIADEEILAYVLDQSSDRAAVRTIRNRVSTFRADYAKHYSGLLAAVNRYDHPALLTYNPDIVLEEVMESNGLVGFSLPANAYSFQARAIGLVVLQHLQHLGALRQMDRTRNQLPFFAHIDECYTFAYQGLIDALNKLRDARISLLLSHQSLSDLERVSPEFARGVWDNTRNKIMLYQNDPDLCERIAAAVGTLRGVSLTVRKSVDGFLNQSSMLEASSREVDKYALHPSAIKALAPGQAYLVQAGLADDTVRPRRWWQLRRPRPREDAGVVAGVHLPLFPSLPTADTETVLAPRRPDKPEAGLRLHEMFIAQSQQ